jgi:rubrerythrin
MEEYIKKSDAETALLALRKGYRKTEEKCAVDGCILEIKDLPTVDAAEVVHGRWIHQEEDIRGISDHQYVCSACGHLYWNARIPNFKYCPHCGAKMDGDES